MNVHDIQWDTLMSGILVRPSGGPFSACPGKNCRFGAAVTCGGGLPPGNAAYIKGWPCSRFPMRRAAPASIGNQATNRRKAFEGEP
jgi:hypothetical protein